jgi:PPOX class probable F420-dependent enzyme
MATDIRVDHAHDGGMPSLARRIVLEPSAALEEFAHHAYLNLETYRPDGHPVRTPMWFVLDGDLLLVRSYGPGKVMRIYQNPHVRVVPCSPRGWPQGVWFDAEAHLAEPSELERARVLFAEKYGMLMRLFELMEKRARRSSTFLVIRVAGAAQSPTMGGQRIRRVRRLRRVVGILAGSLAVSVAATIAGKAIARQVGRRRARRSAGLVVVRPRALFFAPNVRVALPFSAIGPGRIVGRRGARQRPFATRRIQEQAKRTTGDRRHARPPARGTA